jgi:NAD(P)-dependent dehydrogenase (short-subunit alcohol dehydrogenase family)
VSAAPSFDLGGRRALVTGATKGIGRDAAVMLARAGADVFVTGRDAADLREVEDEVRAIGGRAGSAPAELGRPEHVEQLAARAHEAFGGIDVLVNNAALTYVEPFLETRWDHWDEILDVDLRAPVFLAREVARKMVADGRPGSIVNVSSVAGLAAIEGHTAYAAAKAGLLMATKTMALELAPANVRVNAICPTVILTPMGERVWGDPAKGDPMRVKIPLGRFGHPPDISHAILYLASDLSGMVTGTELVIDGGFTAV